MTDHKLTIKFDRGWLKGRSDQIKQWRIHNIKKWFGIYDVYNCKVLEEPKFEKEEGVFTYKLQALRIYSYFLWIKYADRAWDRTKER